MVVMSLIQRINPKNWSVLCWLLIAIWLIPVFWGRLPTTSEKIPQSDGVSKLLADGTRVVMYPGSRFGFPLSFIEITEYSNGDRTFKYDLGRGVLNLVLVCFNLVGIVIAVQKSSWQFSIRALMLSMAILALLIVWAESANFSSGFVVKAVYFTPLIIGGVITLTNSRVRLR